MSAHVAAPDRAILALRPRARRAGHRLVRRLTRGFGASPLPFDLTLPDGDRRHFGEGSPEFHIRVRSPEGLGALASLELGRIAEAYMAGEFDVEGNLVSVFELRRHFSDVHPLNYAWRFLQPLLFGQVATNARAIQTHYDLDASFYLAFLGGLRCYTQGMFENPAEPLEMAQRRKLDFCIESCSLGPGSHVLEVGPGWGAFAEHASARGIELTCVTNSVKSAEYIRGLRRRLGTSWTIVERDILEYDPPQQYDAVVLMGIMEHLPNYPALLQRFARLLKPGGRVYLDASATREKYAASSFIYRHIYPGNHSFFILHDFLAALAKTPFMVRGIYDDRESYYLTFMHWARNLEANREAVGREFGDWQYRRFHLYLWGSAHCFLTDTLQCYRVVLEHPGPHPSSELVRSPATFAAS